MPDALPAHVARALADGYGLSAAGVCPLLRAGSSVNVFLLVAAGRRLVVRQLMRPVDQVARQQDLLAFLAEQGLPVAPGLKTRTGARWLAVEGRVYTVSPFVTGDHPRPGDVEAARAAGDALARLHDATRRFGGAAPNPRAGMTARFLDRAAAAERSLHAVLADPALAPVHDDAAWLAERVARIDAALRETMGDVLPQAVIHGDLNRENVLLEGGAVTGIVDFDLATRDVRIADVAIALQYLARSPEPDGPLVVAAPARALLGAYDGAAGLTPAERRAVRPLAEAKVAMSALRRLLKLASARPAARDALTGALVRSTRRLRRLDLDDRWSVCVTIEG